MSRAFFHAAAIASALTCFAPAPAIAQELRPPGSLTPTQRQDRVEELERLLQAATDENERLQHQLRQSQGEVRRLQSMVNDLAAVRDARDEMSTSGSGEQRTPPPPPARGQQTSAAPSPPARGGSLGSIPASDLPAPIVEPADAYQQARELLLNGQTRQAEQAFSDFLERYGSDRNAPEARYWHSFTLLARDAHQEAAAGFVDYLRRHPSGQRAPDALLRLGVALKGLGRNQQACQAFADLPNRFPRAAQTLRDQAARERRSLRCPSA